jgi:hypothetical protein
MRRIRDEGNTPFTIMGLALKEILEWLELYRKGLIL